MCYQNGNKMTSQALLWNIFFATIAASISALPNVNQKPELVTCHKKQLNGVVFQLFHLEEEKKQGLPYEFECFQNGNAICDSIPESDQVKSSCKKCCLQNSPSSMPDNKTTHSSGVKNYSTFSFKGAVKPVTNAPNLQGDRSTTLLTNEVVAPLLIASVVLGTVLGLVMILAIIYFAKKIIQKKSKNHSNDGANELLNFPTQEVGSIGEQEGSPLNRQYAGLVSTV